MYKQSKQLNNEITSKKQSKTKAQLLRCNSLVITLQKHSYYLVKAQLLQPKSLVITNCLFSLSLGVWLLVMGCWLSVVQYNLTNNRQPTTPKKCFPMKCKSYFVQFLTIVKTFSYLFSEKYFLLFVIPPFHPCMVISLILNGLSKVELWVEYGWNYMKFHQ